MALRTPQVTRSRGRGRALGLAALVPVVALAVGLASPAGAQEPSAAPAELGAVLDGGVDGLSATATYQPAPEFGDMGATVEVVNDGPRPATIGVPFGLLLATADQADQTMAVLGPAELTSTGPVLAEAAAAGATPTITAPVGRSTHALAMYCTEADDGAPMTPTPMRHLGEAGAPLAAVLRTAADLGDGDLLPEAQDAVWWVSDDVTTPVPSELAPLLVDVDTDAFAAAPHRVVPDTGYVPRWARGGVAAERFDADADGIGGLSGSSSDGGLGSALLPLWLVALGVGVVALAVLASRRRDPAGATVPVRAAGWYPDPWGSGSMRWWDGRSWTAHQRRRGLTSRPTTRDPLGSMRR